MSLKNLLTAATVTAEMIERRDRCKELYGSDYALKIKLAQDIVKSVAAQHKLSILEAALKICKTAVEDGHGSAVNMVIAAAVDLIGE